MPFLIYTLFSSASLKKNSVSENCTSVFSIVAYPGLIFPVKWYSPIWPLRICLVFLIYWIVVTQWSEKTNALSKGSNRFFSISINSDSVTHSTFIIGLASTLSDSMAYYKENSLSLYLQMRILCKLPAISKT